jgi:hypothetical protein
MHAECVTEADVMLPMPSSSGPLLIISWVSIYLLLGISLSAVSLEMANSPTLPAYGSPTAAVLGPWQPWSLLMEVASLLFNRHHDTLQSFVGGLSG